MTTPTMREAAQAALDALTYKGDYRNKDRHTKKQAAIEACRAALASQPVADAVPLSGKWEGAEEWMPLAWELCAEECGEDACTELVWEGGPVPEPWGDRWLKYEDEAKRLIALVRKCTAGAAPGAQKADHVPREKFEAMLAAEHAMSDAYVRLRVILGAMDPPTVTDPKALWSYVEGVARDLVAAAHPQQPAEPMVNWPQVVAYPGGAALDCGAWVDVSNGDGPEHVHRYVRAHPQQPAPGPQPFTQAQLRRLYDNSPEIGNDVRSRYGFYRVAMLVEAAHGITATPAPTTDKEPR